jgi:hypothetical protein
MAFWSMRERLPLILSPSKDAPTPMQGSRNRAATWTGRGGFPRVRAPFGRYP